MVTESSDTATTDVVSVSELLLGSVSVVALETVTVLVSVPDADASTLTTSWKVAVAPAGTVVAVAVTVPVPPAAGVMSVKAGPVVCIAETKVVLAGSGSLRTTFWASEGPLLVTVIV